jgi:hypothetical protein
MANDRTNIIQAREAFSISPNDSADLEVTGSTLYIGVSGDVKVTTYDGTDIVFKNVPVGFMPVKVNRVWATGTTASEIIGMYFKKDDEVVA